ncbi:hypothetical protein DNTS_014640 [Danionella cerebrum]|uniref:TIR domain-containing protein n=1 Tax=Danionella cerebrum TaxID=2873325 RepID=A0A553R8K2_9TELE|nr:hypothetical protein DNTS_014640 [Danionella translucida]
MLGAHTDWTTRTFFFVPQLSQNEKLFSVLDQLKLGFLSHSSADDAEVVCRSEKRKPMSGFQHQHSPNRAAEKTAICRATSYLSVCVTLSTSVLIHPSAIYLSVNLIVPPSICAPALALSLSVCRSAHPSIHPSIHPLFYPIMHIVHLSISIFYISTMTPSMWFLNSLCITCFHPSLLLSIQRIIVNYSSQNLSRVPGLDSSTTDLDLSLNQISSLSSEDFCSTPELHFLNLSWNLVENIDRQTFRSTEDLEVLDLSHNRLQDLSNQPYLLSTGRLIFLDLSSNRFPVMTMGREFSTLQRLEWLGLGAESIASQDFFSIRNITLKTLFICASALQTYEEESLTGAHSEKIILALSGRSLDVVMASDALAAFEEVELRKVNRAMDVIQPIQRREYIRTLSLQISKVETSWKVLTSSIALILASSIKKLSFAELTLDNMSGGTPQLQTHVLESFSIERAFVTTFIFDQRMLYDFFINMPARKLRLSQTPIVFMTCPWENSVIQELDLSDCVLTEKLFSEHPDSECGTLRNVKRLILKGNNLKHLGPLTSRIQLMISLEIVDLGQNSLTYSEEQEDCVWPPQLVEVDLSANDFDERVFKCLPDSIQILNLQHNRVTAIPLTDSIFSKLRIIDLTGNRLLDLPSCQPFPNLQTLILRSNSMHSPQPNALQSCSHLTDLDLSRNAFVCTCSLRRFASLINERSNESQGLTFRNWPLGYKCSDPESMSNTLLKDFHIPEISCNTWILAITLLIPTVALMAALSIACIRLDAAWYVKMMWQWTRAKHNALTSQTRPEDLEKFRYHAFVSYSQKNSDWVKSEFLPKLETESGLRVCHHERDFIPGRTIMQNILRSIDQSRKSVFLLSPHFVQSEWCHYELNFAEHQRLNRGSQSVLLVLLEPLPLYLIPSKQQRLRSMMKKRSYLEWPQEGAKQTLFWANLRAALQGPLAPCVEREGQGGEEERLLQNHS